MQKKLLSVVFILISIFALTFAASATDGANEIYIATNGSDINSGTEAAPVATLDKAFELLGTAGGMIYLDGDITVEANDGDCFIEPSHTGKVTITSADIADKGALVFEEDEAKHYHFNGEGEWNNILVKSDHNTGVVISADNNRVIMGEGLEMSSTAPSPGRSGGHSYCGTRIYLVASYCTCENGLSLRTPAGGTLSVYSGEYWSISSWYGEDVILRGGETDIYIGATDDGSPIWVRYLCPGKEGGSHNEYLDANHNNSDEYPNINIIIGSGINCSDIYRFTQNYFTGTMTVNWMLHDSPRGNATSLLINGFINDNNSTCYLNTLADTESAEATAFASAMADNLTEVYFLNINSISIDDYCDKYGHKLILHDDNAGIVCAVCGTAICDLNSHVYDADGACIYCGYSPCRHTALTDVVTLTPTCTSPGRKNTFCSICQEVMGTNIEVPVNSSNHTDYLLEFSFDENASVINHCCEGCHSVLYEQSTAGIGNTVTARAAGTLYTASNPPSGNTFNRVFADFETAMEYAAVLTEIYDDVTLNIATNAYVPASYQTPEFDGNITVTGGILRFYEVPRRFYMNGNMTFENLTFRSSNNTGVHIYAQNHKLVMGEGIVMGNAGSVPTESHFPNCNSVKMYIMGGFDGMTNNVMDTDITIRSGDYWYIGGWNMNATTNDGVSKITIGKTDTDDMLKVFYLTPFSRGDGYITRTATGTIIVDGELFVKRFYVTTLNNASENFNYITNIVLKGDITGYNKDEPNIPFDLRGSTLINGNSTINIYTDSRAITAVEDSYVFLGHPSGDYLRDITLNRLNISVTSYTYQYYCAAYLGGHDDSDEDGFCDECGAEIEQ